MNASFDNILVVAAIATALAFFISKLLRKKKSCGSGCGCDVAKKPLTR